MKVQKVLLLLIYHTNLRILHTITNKIRYYYYYYYYYHSTTIYYYYYYYYYYSATTLSSTKIVYYMYYTHTTHLIYYYPDLSIFLQLSGLESSPLA